MEAKSILKKIRIVLIISLAFTLAYSTLSIVRHLHFGSFGYDLGIVDQITWKYSQFKLPITTIDDTPFSLSLFNHVEFIYLLLAPFYWIWNNVIVLLVVQSLFFCLSAIPIYLLAQKHKLKVSIIYALVLCYLTFYGVQNALWFDVHSTPFGTAFLAWFIYFLDSKKIKAASIFLVLTILTKENFAAYTLVISLFYFLKRRDRFSLLFAGISVGYLFSIFGLFFPTFVKGGYHYQNTGGFLSDANLYYLFDTTGKRNVLFYSLFSYGFLPLLYPLALIPFATSIILYFIFGHSVTTAQDIFLQYRIELVPLLTFGTIITCVKYQWLNKKVTGLFLLVCILSVQYILHLPVSYLTKAWFWQQTQAMTDIQTVSSYIPKNASVVAQNNIIPHLSHRDEIFTLWTEKRHFSTNSPCKEKLCDSLHWTGHPEFLVVSTSSEWDERHFLAKPAEFKEGIANLQKVGAITVYRRKGNAIVFKIVKNPLYYH